MTPAEKLARSRLAIIEYIDRREHRGDRSDDARIDSDAAGADGPEDDRLFGSEGWLGGIASAARTWWRHHPAQLAMEMATPALESYIRRRPFQVLAVSAGVGALLVVTRPWRLISLTTLVVAIVKSSQLSGVVMSALSNARGWHEEQQGREPHL